MMSTLGDSELRITHSGCAGLPVRRSSGTNRAGFCPAPNNALPPRAVYITAMVRPQTIPLLLSSSSAIHCHHNARFLTSPVAFCCALAHDLVCPGG